MPFTLTDTRADVDALLANAVDATTWTSALKDAGVRQALLNYSLQGPVYEADVLVTVGGHEQELSALSDLIAIEAVVWPWSDGLRFEDMGVRWRRAGATVVRFDDESPQAGDRLRVRYRRLHRLSGLDGAGATTVTDAHRAVLAEGATAAVLSLRLRQISENPALPQEAAAVIASLCAERAAHFDWLLARMQGEALNPVWARVGL